MHDIRHSVTFYDNSGFTKRSYVDPELGLGFDLPQNTYKDWMLVPNERPAVEMPDVKTKTLDINNGYGNIDLTYALTEYPLYGTRSGSIDFTVLPDYRPWNIAYTTISAFLHGKRIRMILWDEPNVYYEGTASVDTWKSDEHFSSITINYEVDPFKMEVTTSIDDYLWDSFDFDRGIVIDDLCHSIPIGEELSTSPNDTTDPKTRPAWYEINFSSLPSSILETKDYEGTWSTDRPWWDRTDVEITDLVYGSPLGNMPVIPVIRLYGHDDIQEIDTIHGTKKMVHVATCVGVRVYNSERRTVYGKLFHNYSYKKNGYIDIKDNNLAISMVHPGNTCKLQLWFDGSDSVDPTTGKTVIVLPPQRFIEIIFRRGWL